MLLRHLKLQNFLVFEEVDLDLQGVKLASIIGQHTVDRRRSNGAGKTALLEAIRYALFDQTRSKSKLGIVRSGSEKCIVELEFQAGANAIRVRRVRGADGASSCSVHVDGQLSGDKVRVVNSVIAERLGVDAELFDLIYFFKQGDQFGFAEASPSDRKSVLAKVFKMDSLERCRDHVREQQRLAREAMQRADGAAEACRSRISGMWSPQHLADQELAASGSLASLLQMQHDRALIAQELGDPASDFERGKSEWWDEVQADRLAAAEANAAFNACNDAIAKLQQRRQQQNTSLMQAQAALEAHQAVPEPTGDRAVLQEALEGFKAAHREAQSVSISKEAEVQQLSGHTFTHFAGNDCPTCKQIVPVDHVESVMERTKAAAQEASEKAEAARRETTRLDGEVVQAAANLQNYDRYAADQATVKALTAAVTEARKALATTDSDIDHYREQHPALALKQSEAMARIDTELVDDYQEMLSWYGERIAAMPQPEGLIGEVSIATQEHETTKQQVKERTEADAELIRLEADLEEKQRTLRIWEALSEAFGKDGVQALMIENAIGTIESFANEILHQMQTRFVVTLKTQKQLQSGESRESLDILVYDNGNERPFENYSGGERTLVNLALRLSLSRVISSLHGVKMQSLFLDEVLGPLDEVNREEVVKVVAFLSRSFEQLFVISHTDEVKDIIDTGIVIERHDHHSTVRITDGGRDQND